MLADLVNGAAPSSEPATSTGLSGLIAGAATKPMSLPAALNALRNGQLERPADSGTISELLSADMPTQPAPRPQPYRGEVDEAELPARVDRLEMQARIRRKRDELAAAASYSNDPRANIEDSRRRHMALRRLEELEQQLNGETNV